MKAYTDIEQSKKLAEILPSESADMCYYYKDDKPQLTPYSEHNNRYYIPCYSLAVLLSVIPQEIFDGGYVINITEGCDDKWVLTYDSYWNRNHSIYGLFTGADNLVDACYEMILKLNERKLL